MNQVWMTKKLPSEYDYVSPAAASEIRLFPSFEEGEIERRPGGVEQFADDLAVVHLSAGHRKVERTALAVDDSVDFRRATAPADPDRLIALPPFCAARRAVSFHDGAVDQMQTVARLRRQRVENPLPYRLARLKSFELLRCESMARSFS